MKAWYVLCVPPDTPDGPGDIFGPFPYEDWAQEDAADSCQNRHLVWLGEPAQHLEIRSSSSAAWVRSFHYFRGDAIPEWCAA